MKDGEQVHPFAIVPVEVMLDNRLTLETMRILVTLFSFRNKLTGLAFPSRDAISERCGMHPSNISAATTKLVELGWLVKTGAGGYSKSTRYDIHIPEKVAEQATIYKAKCDARKGIKVAQSATVAEPATIAQSATREGSPSGYTPNSPIGYTQRTDQLTDQRTNNSLPADAGEKSLSPEDELQSACRATWKSYSDSYFNRYGVEPIRNATVNTHIKAFCKKIPHQEAPHVAAFFISHNDKFYIQKTHHSSLMSKDAEGLRTQWATGRTMTASKATQIDKTANNLDTVNQAIEMMRARKQNATA